MDYIFKGEELAKIKAGFLSTAHGPSNCGGFDIYCSSDKDKKKGEGCIHPTTYAGCNGGVLTFGDPPPPPGGGGGGTT